MTEADLSERVAHLEAHVATLEAMMSAVLAYNARAALAGSTEPDASAVFYGFRNVVHQVLTEERGADADLEVLAVERILTNASNLI